MNTNIKSSIKQILIFRWNPGRDLIAVAVGWLLVTGSLYTATFIAGENLWGGFAYFLLYALVCATLFGVGIPLYWTTVVRRQPVQEIGITKRRLAISIVLQLVFSILLYFVTLAKVQLPPPEQLIPLVTLALTIGFFEAVFWRGWVQLRLEDSFGMIPAILIGSALYAAYHIGYGMPAGQIGFLFFIGILFAVVFRLTKNIFILWPVFQPMGQLVTLIEDQLSLPLIAALGFGEVLVLMFVMVCLAGRTQKKRQAAQLPLENPSPV